jgi:hypothetical protein
MQMYQSDTLLLSTSNIQCQKKNNPDNTNDEPTNLI